MGVTMQRKELIFVISKTGEVTSTVKGVNGASCQGIIDKVADIGEVKAKEKTSEFYQKEVGVGLHQFTGVNK